MKKLHLADKYELNKTISGNASWFFLVSIIMTLFLLILNIIVLYVNPSQVNDIKITDTIQMGYYSLTVATGKMYLNWASYLTGIMTIILVIIDCFTYYMLIASSLRPFYNSRILMVHLISGVTICVLLFILNIFNKPTIFTLSDPSHFNLVTNGFNPDVTKETHNVQFNYVYNINFFSNGYNTISSRLELNYFNIIWILGMIGCTLVYLISLFMFLYYKQVKLSPILRKVQYE